MVNLKVERDLESMVHQMLEILLLQQANISLMDHHYSTLDHQIKIWVDIQLVDSTIEAELVWGEATSKDPTVALIMQELTKATLSL